MRVFMIQKKATTMLLVTVLLTCFSGFFVQALGNQQGEFQIATTKNLDYVMVDEVVYLDVKLNGFPKGTTITYDAILSEKSTGEITTAITQNDDDPDELNIRFQANAFGMVQLKLMATVDTNNKKQRFEKDIMFMVSDGKEPELSFGVLSDIHIGAKNADTRLKNALYQLKLSNPKYDALGFVGDFTNTGATEEYQQFQSIIAPYLNGDRASIITMGNHEFFQGRPTQWNASPPTDEALCNRFEEQIGVERVYYEKEINGYQFIALAGEKMWSVDEVNDDNAHISEEQYRWLEETLAKSVGSSKPIMVFLHQQISDTVVGSDFFNGGLNDKRLYTILSGYPQVILFSGHSHFTAEHPNTVLQQDFTMVNVASVFEVWEYEKKFENKSQGLVVEAYDDRVVLKHKDFSTNQWVNIETIQTPYSPKDREKITPYFLEDGNLTVLEQQQETITVSFDIATSKNIVDKYIVMQNGVEIYRYYIPFWNQQRFDNITVRIPTMQIDPLQPIELYASDIYGNRSDPLMINLG